MPTKSYTLILYLSQDHNIQSWRNLFFAPIQGGQQSFGVKKITFSSRYEMCLFGFLFLGELGTCLQNLMPTQGVEPWKNHQFPQGGMLKFTYNKNSIWKILGLKIRMVETCSSASSTYRNFYFWNKLKSGFLVVFQSLVFGQIWARFAALTVVESIPEARLKSLKPFHPSTMNPNVTWSVSLESYHPYLQPQKVSKNPQTYITFFTLAGRVPLPPPKLSK
jgi:hypothetical protein